MSAIVYSYSEKEIQDVQKALGIEFTERDKYLLQTDRYSELIEGIEDPTDKTVKRSAKFHLFRNSKKEVGVNVFYKKEALVIPEYISGHKLTHNDKQQLMSGNIIQVKNQKGQNLYVQVDKDLNAVIVRGDRELGIPDVIGFNDKFKYSGYSLSDTDKLTYAAGGILEPKVLCGDEGFFLARVGMTSDKKGYILLDYQTISNDKVQEYIAKYNKPLDSELQANISEDKLLLNDKLSDNKINRDLDIEFSNALEKRDFVKLNQMSEEGYKPAAQQISQLESMSGLSENDKIAVKTIFKVSEEAPALQNDENNKVSHSPEIKKGEEKTNLLQHANEPVRNDNRKIEKIGNVMNQAFQQM